MGWALMAATEDCCLGRAIEFVLVLQYDTLDVFKVGPTPVFALIESGHYIPIIQGRSGN